MTKNVILSCLTITLLFGWAFAQQEISGPQSGILGPGSYLVVGSIQVISGETMTIVPGTEFLHNGHYVWQIYGQLNAEGTEGDSIVFKRQNPIDDHKWGGIRFMSGASQESSIDYCIIEYAYNGMIPIGTAGAGIYTDAVDLFISNTRVSHCSAYWDGAGICAL